MEQTGEYDVPAERGVVWTALNDPEVLGRCITGCQDVVRKDDRHFDVKVKAKVGPVSATFQAELELDDLNPPESYTIKGGVKGGAAGFGKGEARVKLEPVDETTTRLSYEVKASVGGKLAQVGSRLVDGAARKMADEFFSAFRDHLSPPSEETVGTPGADDAESDQNNQNQPSRYESSGGGLIWIIAFVVLALAILFAI